MKPMEKASQYKGQKQRKHFIKIFKTMHLTLVEFLINDQWLRYLL